MGRAQGHMRRSTAKVGTLAVQHPTTEWEEPGVFSPPLLGLQSRLRFGRDPGGLSFSFSSTGPSYKWTSSDLPEVMTSPGQARNDTPRAVRSAFTCLALFLDDSCSGPHDKINVSSSSGKLLGFL